MDRVRIDQPAGLQLRTTIDYLWGWIPGSLDDELRIEIGGRQKTWGRVTRQSIPKNAHVGFLCFIDLRDHIDDIANSTISVEFITRNRVQPVILSISDTAIAHAKLLIEEKGFIENRLGDIVCCPKCRCGELRLDAEVIACLECGSTYSQEGFNSKTCSRFPSQTSSSSIR